MIGKWNGRMRSVVLSAICISLPAVVTVHAAITWKKTPDPWFVGYSPGGDSLKVKVGDAIDLNSACQDCDEWTDGGCLEGWEPDLPTRVRFSVPTGFGTLSNNQKVPSGSSVTWTAPANIPDTNPQNLSIYGDDNRDNQDARDDTEKLLKTIPITIVNNCPTSITVDTNCTWALGGQSNPGTFGGKVYKMKANPVDQNWDGYVVTEALSVGQGSTCNDANDFTPPMTKVGVCTGQSSFTIGSGQPEWYGCARTAQQNRFHDVNGAKLSFAVLKNGRGPCTVVCNQVYKCGGQNIGSFTITYTLTNVGAGSTAPTEVSLTKS